MKKGDNWNTVSAVSGLTLGELRTLNGGTLGALAIGQVVKIGPKPSAFVTGFSDGVGGAAAELVQAFNPANIVNGIKGLISNPFGAAVAAAKGLLHWDELKGIYNAWRSGDQYHLGYYVGKLLFGIAIDAISYIAGGAAVKLVKEIKAAKTADKGASAAAKAAKTKKVCPTCQCSFSGDTPVLMADGTTKPIEDIHVGDQVTATDPDTDTTTPEPVTATHLNDDHNLLDLTITTPQGTTTIHTTDNHPFYDQTTRTWTDAGHLTPGHHLRTTTGTTATVTALTTITGHQPMHNLTIDHTHTYYVLAGTTPVLVHNSVCIPALRDFRSRAFRFGKSDFLLTKERMEHILTRHHPDYWDGSTATRQTFFDRSMTIDDVQSAVGSVMRQNQRTLAVRGNGGSYQITGTYGGREYVLGITNGRIGQFFPK